MAVAQVNPAGPDLAKGDVGVLISGGDALSVVTKGLPEAAAVAGRAWGIARAAASRGQYAAFFRDGYVPREVTGLPAQEGLVRLGTNGRAEMVEAYQAGDIPLGKTNARGELNVAFEMGAGIVPGVGGITTDDTIDRSGSGILALKVSEELIGGTFIKAGAEAVARIAAALAVGTAIVLGPGTFTLPATLDISRDGQFFAGAGEGRTVIRWGAAVGDTSSPTNAMIRAQGVEDRATLDTTPTDAANPGRFWYPPGADAIGVASIGALTIGPSSRWVLYRGHNNYNYAEYGSSPGATAVWADLVQLREVAADRLRLAHALLSYHTLTNGGAGEPMTIRAAVPRIGLRIRDLTLDGANVAVGVLLDIGADFKAERVGLRNFSLAGFYSRWCRTYKLDAIHLDGGVNSMWIGEATHDTDFGSTTSNDRGKPFCDVGRIFGWIQPRENCSSGRLHDNDVANMSMGPCLASFRNWQIDNDTYRDLDNTEMRIRDPFQDDYSLGVMGVGIHMGFVSLNAAEFNAGLSMSNVVVERAYTAQFAFADNDDCGIWLHDTWNVNIHGLTIRAKGKGTFQNIDGKFRAAPGLRMQDWEGNLVGYYATGCEAAMRFNSANGAKVSVVRLSQSISQGGPLPEWGFRIATGGYGENMFSDVTTWNISFDYGYMSQLDYSEFLVRGIRVNDWYYGGDCFCAQNFTGALRGGGSMVALDTRETGTLRKAVVTNHANASTTVFRFVTNQGGFGVPDQHYCLLESPTPIGRFLCNTDEVNMGQEVKLVGGGAVTVSPLGAGARVGFALSTKAGGVAGSIMGGR